MRDTLDSKYEELKNYLTSLGSVAVAYSSGVDSTFLLKAACEALGDKACAFTAASASFPPRELNEAKEFCSRNNIRHLIVNTDELSIEGFADNPKDRCYLCKKDLFTRFLDLAAREGINEVVEGSNLDDNGDYRPGLKAIAELNIISPLRKIGFTKNEIRLLSERLGLPTYKKPSYACLASRIPYGERITGEKLSMIDRAEQKLMDMGFLQVRVRVHGDLARIELLPSDFDRFMEEKIRSEVYDELKRIGFSYITLDILGYRTGSMNEVLQKLNS